ncbi:MAG: hypothetical protein ABI685_13100 [Ferruginibacter sp.]
MKMIVNTKSKKQEKAVKTFLDDLDIEFLMVKEEEAVYKTSSAKQHNKKEKRILENLSQSVDFINKHRKGKGKAKPLNQFLNEL